MAVVLWSSETALWGHLSSQLPSLQFPLLERVWKLNRTPKGLLYSASTSWVLNISYYHHHPFTLEMSTDASSVLRPWVYYGLIALVDLRA